MAFKNFWARAFCANTTGHLCAQSFCFVKNTTHNQLCLKLLFGSLCSDWRAGSRIIPDPVREDAQGGGGRAWSTRGVPHARQEQARRDRHRGPQVRVACPLDSYPPPLDTRAHVRIDALSSIFPNVREYSCAASMHRVGRLSHSSSVRLQI